MTALSECSRVEQARAYLEQLGVTAPELIPYQDEPAQMGSGGVGKYGYLHLGFTKDDERRSILSELDRRVPFLVQKALYWDEGMPHMPCVFIITPTGCILQGDRMALEIEVGPEASAHVTTQCATKVHMMNANYASQTQNIVIDEGGYLEYMPDALIPHRTSRFLSETTVTLAETGTLLYSEILLPGRKYHHEEELFGFNLYSSTIKAIRKENGKKLFVEKFIVDPKTMNLKQTGIMNGYEVFGNVVLLAPLEKALEVSNAMGAAIEKHSQLAYGSSLLPHGCGIVFKILGMTSETVKGKIREFWKIARKATTGYELPEAFLWQ